MSAAEKHTPDVKPRLSRLQAAWVIARRDFIAVLFSRAFLFFLLGPLFPVIVGGLAGSIGGQVSRDAVSVEIGIAMSAEESAAMLEAAERLRPQLGAGLPTTMRKIPKAQRPDDFDPRAYMEERKGDYAAIVAGTLQAPQVIGTQSQIARMKGPVSLIAAEALRAAPSSFPEVAGNAVTSSAASDRSSRLRTAQVAQMVLFLLTMLLAGMVLSNLAEEKGNKIIEILAAAIPMDAVFMGKLFAMLGLSLIHI